MTFGHLIIMDVQLLSIKVGGYLFCNDPMSYGDTLWYQVAQYTIREQFMLPCNIPSSSLFGYEDSNLEKR